MEVFSFRFFILDSIHVEDWFRNHIHFAGDIKITAIYKKNIFLFFFLFSSLDGVLVILVTYAHLKGLNILNVD